MRGDAVHRRRHAVLAHAVMDIAAGIVAGAHLFLVLGPGVVRGRQIGRAADQLGHHRDSASSTVARGLAGRDLGVRPAKSAQSVGDRIVEAGGQLAALAAQEFGALARPAAACRRALPGLRGPRRRARRPRATRRGRRRERRRAAQSQPSRSRAPLISSAPSAAAVRRGGAGLGRRAKGDDRAAGDQGRPVALVRALDRGGDRVGVVAVDALGRPAMGAEAQRPGRRRPRARSGRRSRSRCRPRARSASTSRRWPASDSASWLIPSIRQPSPQNT